MQEMTSIATEKNSTIVFPLPLSMLKVNKDISMLKVNYECAKKILYL